MKADLRISVKEYSRTKNLKVQLTRVAFPMGWPRRRLLFSGFSSFLG
jgi:hypothetical protein